LPGLAYEGQYFLELKPGRYRVTFRCSVGKGVLFYDGNAHMRLEDHARWAREEDARLWTGEAVSNELRLVHGAVWRV
jgi:hypothetical protein